MDSPVHRPSTAHEAALEDLWNDILGDDELVNDELLGDLLAGLQL